MKNVTKIVHFRVNFVSLQAKQLSLRICLSELIMKLQSAGAALSNFFAIAFSILIGRKLRPFPDNSILFLSHVYKIRRFILGPQSFRDIRSVSLYLYLLAFLIVPTSAVPC